MVVVVTGAGVETATVADGLGEENIESSEAGVGEDTRSSWA